MSRLFNHYFNSDAPVFDAPSEALVYQKNVLEVQIFRSREGKKTTKFILSTQNFQRRWKKVSKKNMSEKNMNQKYQNSTFENEKRDYWLANAIWSFGRSWLLKSSTWYEKVHWNNFNTDNRRERKAKIKNRVIHDYEGRKINWWSLSSYIPKLEGEERKWWEQQIKRVEVTTWEERWKRP